jgi:chromatin segregation and condensation protein Rec8/ScpA/Scc1 (kleisin family)
LELDRTKIAIQKTVALLDEITDMPELQTKLTELNSKRKSLQEQVAQEESKSAAIATNPATVAKFKDLMKGVDYEALDKAADSIHFRLKDDKVRDELRNILPDFIKRITCNLSKWEYDVEFVSGEIRHFVFNE